MSTEKISSSYEPPPPYTTSPAPQAPGYPTAGHYGANVGEIYIYFFSLSNILTFKDWLMNSFLSVFFLNIKYNS